MLLILTDNLLLVFFFNFAESRERSFNVATQQLEN